MAKRRTAVKNDLNDRIQKVVQTVNKECPSENGDSSIQVWGRKNVAKVPVFSSNSIALDKALGGGYPWGRIIEIFGPEGGGKTTLVLHAIATVQRDLPDAMVAFIDAENSLDLYYAKNLGVKVSDLMISQPDSGEQALNIAKVLVQNGVKLIAIDSVAALTPLAMLQEDIGKDTIGLHARLIGSGVRILNTLLSSSGATILFTNQMRNTIGTMGSPWTTTGGNALRFYASQRIEVRRIGSDIDSDKNRINNIVVAKVTKNKVAPPFLKAQFKITFGKGIDRVEQIIDLGTEFGLIVKSGSWFTVTENGERVQGRTRLYSLLEQDKKTMDTLEKKILEQMQGVNALEHSAEIQDKTPDENAKDEALPDVAERLVDPTQEDSVPAKDDDAQVKVDEV